MQLKTMYIEDSMQDWSLLASIIKPSEEDPFRELIIKWLVKGNQLPLSAVMRSCDTVYIASAGIAMTRNGEPVRYQLYHSVEIPEIRELTEFQIMRANLSVCEFYRQREEDCVEVYTHCLFSPMGDVPERLSAMSTVQVTVSMFKHLHCAEAKKLTRLLACRQQQQHSRLIPALSGPGSSPPSSASQVIVDSTAAVTTSSSPRACAVCLQSTSDRFASLGSLKEKTCRICSVSVCSRCRVYKIIYLPTAVEKELLSAKMAFCARCIRFVVRASSAKFTVLDALAVEGKSVDYSKVLIT